MDCVLNGECVLCGELRCEIVGFGGSCKFGKVVGLVGGVERGL